MSSDSTPFSLAGRRIYVAGHRGMVGSAVVRRLAGIDCDVVTATRADLDLRRQPEVETWMEQHRPDVVVVAAATVGGILANDTMPARFLYDNLMIEANLIHSAHLCGAEKLLFLGSSCIYPREAPQPMTESALLTGPLEPTNQWYAIAKITGIKLCQAYRRQYGSDFISAMPTNLYGPGDNYDLQTSHVLPALIRKIVEARDGGDAEVAVWGTGRPLREFLHADDLADALIFLLENYSGETHVNVGSGQEISIGELAGTVASMAGYRGRLRFETDKPDGTPRKLMDSQYLFDLGWHPSLDLKTGLERTIADFERTRSDGSPPGIRR